MKSKKAISAVVATVLIILITVAAVTIIWAAIIPMIKENIQGGQECLDAVSQVSLLTDGGYTCINKSGNSSVQIQVGRGEKDFTMDNIQVTLSIGGNSKSAKVGVHIGPNEEELITLNGSIFDDKWNNISNATKVEIAPYVRIGQTETLCGKAGEATLNSC
ncbi:MAG: hypothetical protein ACP5D2_00600 [Candidatus Nanoarchaeia archaeon]